MIHKSSTHTDGQPFLILLITQQGGGGGVVGLKYEVLLCIFTEPLSLCTSYIPLSLIFPKDINIQQFRTRHMDERHTQASVWFKYFGSFYCLRCSAMTDALL